MKRLLEADIEREGLWLPDDIWQLLWLQCDSLSRHALRCVNTAVWRSTQRWQPRLDLTLQCHSACGHPDMAHVCGVDKAQPCLQGVSVEIVQSEKWWEQQRFYRHERFEAREFVIVVQKDRVHFHLSRKIHVSWFRVQSTRHLILYNDSDRFWHPSDGCNAMAANVVECLLNWIEPDE